MIFKTKGKGDWEVIQLNPKDIFSAAKYLYKSLENGSLEDYVFYNITDNKQYRIEVK